MNTQNLYHFNLLKKVVSEQFLKTHTLSFPMEDWKGEDIVLFQEDLFSRTKAKVSEKWFYTYFKNSPEKLPRIDMLNLLSTYAGYDSWNQFKELNKTQSSKKKMKSIYWLLLIIPITIFVLSMINAKNEFNFCFVDDTYNQAITKIPLDIKIIQEKESPIYLKTDSLGCFSYKTRDEVIKFVVQSPYHKTDTIVRYKNSQTNEMVRLTSDDYALMLDFYLKGNVTDWKKHKQKLSNLISDDAIIYQLFDQNLGIELYSKEEFVRFLTIPTSNLKHIDVLDREFKNGKIVKLKFMVK